MDSTGVICRNCGAGAAIRISRVGFFQRKVLSFFGVYPWKCGACGDVFLFPSRGHGTRSRRSSKHKQQPASGQPVPLEANLVRRTP